MAFLGFDAATQGSLDVKYLADRYNVGVTRVTDYMSVHQRYVKLAALEDGLPDQLTAVRAQSPTAQLVRNQLMAFQVGGELLVSSCST